ncbi:helix-turn-helix transcriptional regulator [Leifsonia sp. H3M29-4]|uniref:helix-turn-helix domain-containing protein n=1 Tax=Salinibacterium metalliresistens TaxID=3031321 RepID=UPI0023DB3596|nr:helix-turn-helix transcriptional regulator [Salinibacterium metalliresistens]MDF1478783.1 helix-turn-helix transcriptional regulator [Salinibacterium metalliresistens]
MVSGPASVPAWADFATALGHNLRRARAARNLTQEELVELAGISLYSYQQYERGAATRGGAPTNPRLATILAICQALDVEIGDVLPGQPRLTTT